MKTKHWLSSGILTAALVFAGVAIAQKYPTIDSAQHHIQEAIQQIDAAQEAHHGKLGGHAAKAKELLQQANQELQAAKEYAAQHHE
jgi:N-formylglutamate amidohydrolase